MNEERKPDQPSSGDAPDHPSQGAQSEAPPQGASPPAASEQSPAGDAPASPGQPPHSPSSPAEPPKPEAPETPTASESPAAEPPAKQPGPIDQPAIQTAQSEAPHPEQEGPYTPPAVVPQAESIQFGEYTTLRLARFGIIRRIVQFLSQINVREFFELFQGINLGQLPLLVSKIGAIFDVPDGFDHPDGVKQRVKILLEALAIYARMTPGDRDNELIDRIDHMLTKQPALDSISEIVAELLREQADPIQGADVRVAVLAKAKAGHAAVFRANAIPWDLVVQLVAIISQILRDLRGK